MTLRLGAVSYLNTKPLIEGLEVKLTLSPRSHAGDSHSQAASPLGNLLLDLPSRLADRLLKNLLDVALIPSVEYFRGPSNWTIVSNACIACRGPVRSVRLLFRCPPDRVRTLALDEGSRTSAALSQVMLHERFGIRPELIPLPITADFYQAEADAVLVIGDRAMQLESGRFVADWDLGQQWCQWTGLPFVFAMWVSALPTEAATRQLVTNLLEECRDLGVENVEKIARRESSIYHLTVEDCLHYFTRQLHFHLGPAELAGLERFRLLASQLGLIPVQDDSSSNAADSGCTGSLLGHGSLHDTTTTDLTRSPAELACNKAAIDKIILK